MLVATLARKTQYRKVNAKLTNDLIFIVVFQSK